MAANTFISSASDSPAEQGIILVPSGGVPQEPSSSSDSPPFTGGVTWVHPSIGCVTELSAPYKQVVVETKGREENAPKKRTNGNISRLK